MKRQITIKDRLDKGLVDVGLLLEPVDTTKYDFIRLSQKETWGILLPGMITHWSAVNLLHRRR